MKYHLFHAYADIADAEWSLDLPLSGIFMRSEGSNQKTSTLQRHGAACKQRHCLCWHPLKACSYRCLNYLHKKAYCLANEMYIVLTVVKCAAIVMAVQFAQFGISRLYTPCWSLLGISKGKVDLDAIG